MRSGQPTRERMRWLADESVEPFSPVRSTGACRFGSPQFTASPQSGFLPRLRSKCSKWSKETSKEATSTGPKMELPTPPVYALAVLALGAFICLGWLLFCQDSDFTLLFFTWFRPNHGECPVRPSSQVVCTSDLFSMQTFSACVLCNACQNLECAALPPLGRGRATCGNFPEVNPWTAH